MKANMAASPLRLFYSALMCLEKCFPRCSPFLTIPKFQVEPPDRLTGTRPERGLNTPPPGLSFSWAPLSLSLLVFDSAEENVAAPIFDL